MPPIVPQVSEYFQKKCGNMESLPQAKESEEYERLLKPKKC